MLKRKFRRESRTVYKYLIEENSLVKDSKSAEEILNTLFYCPVTFLREVNRKDGTKVCLFYVDDYEDNIFNEAILFKILVAQAMIGSMISIKTWKQYKKQLKILNRKVKYD